MEFPPGRRPDAMGPLMRIFAYMKKLLVILFASWIMLPVQAMGSGGTVREQVIHVSHPSHPGEQLTKTLIAHLDATGDIQAYSMEVDSVICLDVQCEIIPVKLYWDEIGQYVQFELPGGGHLTKTDHVLFTQADYEKLHEILGDRRSILRELSSDRIVDPTKAIETTDGVSAPTPVSMQHEVVVGAAYTCYTLWHWANGEVVDQIRYLTAQNASTEQLLKLYQQAENEKTQFALEQLEEREAYSDDILNVIIDGIPLQGDAIKRCLQYLTHASAARRSDVLFKTIESNFAQYDKSQRIHILEFLAKSPLIPPRGFYDSLATLLPDLESYYEVHLMLTLQQEHNSNSRHLIQNTTALLASENFLIARRAYWFLSEKPLSPQQSAAVEAFRKLDLSG